MITMSKRPNNSLASQFQPTPSYPARTKNSSFHGAVFNALDEHLKIAHCFNMDLSDLTTSYVSKGDLFEFIIQLRWPNDNPPVKLEEYIDGFLHEVYESIEREELEDSIACNRRENHELPGLEYTLQAQNPSELMQVMESLLQRYEFEENYLPTFKQTGIPADPHQAKPSMCFAMFAESTMERIRAIYYSTQAAIFTGQGLHLNH